ncbi:MAG: exodeoxyribonuclease V subunit alpha [Pelodictyon phaeoclathratiforme]
MSRMYQERAIDRHFAAFICHQATGGVSELFRLVVSLASSAVGQGSSCLNLQDIAEESIVIENKEFRLPRLDALMELLKSASVVSFPGGHFRPLVLDATGRLYLYRYWHYEQELQRTILRKAGAAFDTIDETILLDALERLFPSSGGRESDRQKDATVVALRRQFCVLSGAPGTGKTSTVVRILALLREQKWGMKQRIAMAAPTGKAAARLKTSISDIKRTLDCSEEVKSAIPDEVVTIHRLLGTISGSTRFRHSASNPLPFDTVIIDEASMVALPLMSLLVTALKADARLILLGDHNQLASVEAGSVFGDICSAGSENDASPLSNSMVLLEKNYRFHPGSGIAEISRAVNEGLEREAVNLLKRSRSSGVTWQELPAPEELQHALANKAVEGFHSYLDAASPAEALERFDRFRILCALRDGPYGVSGLNRTVENILARKALISPASTFYRGRPLMITVNNYAMRLFNGDTGILFPDPENGGSLRAFFFAPDGEIRSIAPERLPQHETAFAITIHKSQGSEFDRLLMLLPPIDSEILTRELIYTGITSAKESVEIWANEEVFCAAVKKQTKRSSGLHF